ncbi:carbohydrate sulfotransferase 1-like [Pecten maximus]|uniref:carbohydrate sulfotransferase 1-like n=1 Tax=Pecten maximus TaxID=6579 RepID=UPI0014583936|nr:carbohydrate sulfotransferase 1-like [Pecten maximus]
MIMRGNTILLSLTIVNVLLFTYIFRSVKQEELDTLRNKFNLIDEYSNTDLSDKTDPLKELNEDDLDGSQAVKVKPIVSPAQQGEVKENLPLDQPTLATTGPTPIILHTYMRSGSSFVGDLLKAGAETFYTYEPVHALQFTIRRLAPIRYLDSPSKTFNNFLDVAVPTVRDMVTCQFSRLPFPYFEDGFFSYSTKASVFTSCNDRQRTITDTKRAYRCATELSKECSKYSSFVAKIIRMPLYSFEELMEKIPNLKIIHLLRDPRPTMLSQMKAGNVKQKYLRSNVTTYCNRVYDDVVKAEDFNRKFPDRLMRVYYEDIVKRPFELTRKMYNFAGMSFTDKVSDKISKLTGQTENRKSSDDTASAWRLSVDMDFIRTVDTSCGQLYTKVGFLDMTTEADIRDTAKSLRGPPPPFDDFRLA